jgi:DNA-binding transcriptional MerR regulator
MNTIRQQITIEEFADFHQVTTELIKEFADFGLINMIQVERQYCIDTGHIERCERAIRIYKDLGVNKEGIEIILDMREKHAQMQQELRWLRHQLKKHEKRMNQLFSEEPTKY